MDDLGSAAGKAIGACRVPEARPVNSTGPKRDRRQGVLLPRQVDLTPARMKGMALKLSARLLPGRTDAAEYASG